MIAPWALLGAGLLATVPPAERGMAPAERGMALGLFSAEPGFDYGPLLQEIRELNATHVSVVWVWWQQDVTAVDIGPRPGRSATTPQVVRTLQQARKLGLHTTLFPIVRLLEREEGEWRGRIDPSDEDRWWSAYTEFILETALVAKHTQTDRLSVGSELLSRETMRDRWLDLIDRVRLRAPEVQLMYSANWDHYKPVSFWDAVDVVGMTAYWELTEDLDAETDRLRQGWRRPLKEVRTWAQAIGRNVVFTEVGYPSLDGGAAFPWDETRRAPPDPEEQRRAYEAFVQSWSDQPILQGAYFWNWFGFGGPTDGGYTPRHKPAAGVIRAWFEHPHPGVGASSLRP